MGTAAGSGVIGCHREGIITPSLRTPAALLRRIMGENGGQKVCRKCVHLCNGVTLHTVDYQQVETRNGCFSAQIVVYVLKQKLLFGHLVSTPHVSCFF